MAAFMAGGAIVGGLIAASRATPRNSSTLAVTALGWGAAITITGLAPNLPIALVALAFVGYGSITFNSTAKTTLQLAARADMRGRVMALWALAWGGSTVLGGPLVGWVASQLGSRWGLLVGGIPTRRPRRSNPGPHAPPYEFAHGPSLTRSIPGNRGPWRVRTDRSEGRRDGSALCRATA